jgi:hypothetical protein
MRPVLTLSRIGLATAVTGLAALAAAAPAGAREAAPEHTWVSPSLPVVTNVASNATKPKSFKVTIYNQTSLAARNVTVQIDASRLPAALTAVLPGADQGCTASGAVATCKLAELAGDASHAYTMGIAPGDLEASEWSGNIHVTSEAENSPGEQSSEGIMQLTGPGIDLVIADIDDVTLAPGASTNVPIALRNEGNVAADGVAVVLSTTHYLELPNPYSNCSYSPEDLGLVCFFDQPIDADETFVLDPETPLKLKVSDTAPGPYNYGAWAAVVPLSDEVMAKKASAAKTAGGKELRLVPATNMAARGVAEDLNFEDNAVDFTVKVPLHKADSVAIGATVNGASGETKTIKVGVRNDGPADTLTPGEEWASSAEITLPTGLTVQQVDEQCIPVIGGQPLDWEQRGKANGLVYQCWPSEHVEAGRTHLFPFTVKISGPAGAAGSIIVDGGVQDPDTTNNTAAISLSAGDGGGGGGGGLPVTGASAGAVAIGGTLLLGAGVVAVVVARRRRIVTVVD